MFAEQRDRIGQILVVDDNLQNRMLVEAHLAAAGYAVTLAEDGEQAVEMFTRSMPDVVLLDVVMPKMDGFEACRRMRAARHGAEAAIVFLTALSEMGAHQDAMQAGADDFLTKPINRTELLMRVRSLVWMKRLKEGLRNGYDLIRSQREALFVAQRQKEDTITYIVHDLQNPLASILANTEYLIGQDSLMPELRDASYDILEASRAMQRMVQNLLDISRSEDGALVPNPQPIDLIQLIKQVQVEMSYRASEKQLRVETDFNMGEAKVFADPDLLRRLVENLLDNSFKYSPQGSFVEMKAKVDGDNYIEFRVVDHGVGIPEEMREQVFEKYVKLERGDSAQRSRRAGRGLGLAFCRLAVDVHGGRIWVEPAEPTGAAFCVRLPKAQ
jgi:two-component system sensor histidine kinase/response regulator